uniref:EGF-like domain-containing protein n=1 Tax=Timema shepardi TaxID=629360 RepID=A0A7R9B683_TIMSH|nr:unnamed protein product [Timema shepardi]
MTKLQKSSVKMSKSIPQLTIIIMYLKKMYKGGRIEGKEGWRTLQTSGGEEVRDGPRVFSKLGEGGNGTLLSIFLAGRTRGRASLPAGVDTPSVSLLYSARAEVADNDNSHSTSEVTCDAVAERPRPSPHICICRNGDLCNKTDTEDLTCECPEDFLGRLCEDYVLKTGSPGSGANKATIVVTIVVALLVQLISPGIAGLNNFESVSFRQGTEVTFDTPTFARNRPQIGAGCDNDVTQLCDNMLTSPGKTQISLSADEIAAILEEPVGLLEAEIYITPPDNPLLSDEDSGHEEETNFDHLSGNQLKAVSEARITKVVSGEIVTEEVQFFEELTSLEGFPGPKSYDPAPKSRILDPVSEASTSQEKKNKKPIRKWVRKDIKDVQSKTWTLPQFMAEDMTFELTLGEMRIFLAILLLTGYNPLPRYKMYWEMSDDGHNEAVSKAISRGRFENITKYLHMCDNTNLSASDKFAKNEKYDLFFDDFFTSLSLLDELKERGCTGTGAVRSNRVENAPLKESTVLKKCQEVHLIRKSKCYSRSDNRYIEVVTPSAIISCNSFMGGVDRLDVNISKLRIHFRMLFAFPINVSINNAWLIYRQMPRYKEQPWDFLGFTRQVTNFYFQKYSARKITRNPLTREFWMMLDMFIRKQIGVWSGLPVMGRADQDGQATAVVNIVDAVQTLKLSDLNVDQKYSVDKLKVVVTKFGRRLIVYIDGCAYMTAENINTLDVSDRHVIYKVKDRGYIEFYDSPLKYYPRGDLPVLCTRGRCDRVAQAYNTRHRPSRHRHQSTQRQSRLSRVLTDLNNIAKTSMLLLGLPYMNFSPGHDLEHDHDCESVCIVVASSVRRENGKSPPTSRSRFEPRFPVEQRGQS